MNDESTKKTPLKSNDGLALIVGGLFILALVFATYNYFNAGKNKEEGTQQEKTSITEKIKEMVGKEEENKGDVNGEGVETSKEEIAAGTAVTQSESQNYWQATNYKSGDITGGSHTVKAGDTLWEIAEARYGNGAEWVKILDANFGSIGYLPNGQHSLIMVGQVLVLP